MLLGEVVVSKAQALEHRFPFKYCKLRKLCTMRFAVHYHNLAGETLRTIKCNKVLSYSDKLQVPASETAVRGALGTYACKYVDREITDFEGPLCLIWADYISGSLDGKVIQSV